MHRDVVATTANSFIPKLLNYEDFNRFERDGVYGIRSIVARLKGQGRSRSRTGAERMRLILYAFATGRTFVVPNKDVSFTERGQVKGLIMYAEGIRATVMKDDKGNLPASNILGDN